MTHKTGIKERVLSIILSYQNNRSTKLLLLQLLDYKREVC